LFVVFFEYLKFFKIERRRKKKREERRTNIRWVVVKETLFFDVDTYLDTDRVFDWSVLVTSTFSFFFFFVLLLDSLSLQTTTDNFVG